MKGDVVWRCVAWAVTPVHIGSGEDWVKSDYTIRDGRLCRFDPASVVLRMDPKRRREFERAVDRGDLQGADRILKDSVGDLDIVETIPLGPKSREELGKAQTDPGRWGEVKPFVRTAGRPFVPGSSIKGAIRTALLSEVVQQKGVAQAKRVLAEAGARAPDRLQQWAFDYDGRHTEQDPFRFLQVSDAVLPEGATRIDRVVNWSPNGGDSEKIQMHVERLVARCDGQGAPRFSFEIRIDAGRLREARRRDGDRVPRFDGLTADFLGVALKRYYWKRLDWELATFFSHNGHDKKILAWFDYTWKKHDGTVAHLTHDKLRQVPRCLLLRLGRFGHFESKSVDDIRSGLERLPVGHHRRAHSGSTRNVVQLGDTVSRSTMAPLGWVLVLVRREERCNA